MTDHKIIEQPEGHHPLHVWKNDDGQVWACCAYDHGPFCRLCQPVDDALMSVVANVAEGNMVARTSASGDIEVSLTPKGKAKAENLVHNTVGGAMYWAHLENMGRDG